MPPVRVARSRPGAGPAAAVLKYQYFMEKRVLLAVVLSFVVLYGYQAMFPPPQPQPRPPAGQTATAPTTPPAGGAVPGGSTMPAEAPQPAAVAPAAPIVADAAERDVTF